MDGDHVEKDPVKKYSKSALLFGYKFERVVKLKTTCVAKVSASGSWKLLKKTSGENAWKLRNKWIKRAIRTSTIKKQLLAFRKKYVVIFGTKRDLTEVVKLQRAFQQKYPKIKTQVLSSMHFMGLNPGWYVLVLTKTFGSFYRARRVALKLRRKVPKVGIPARTVYYRFTGRLYPL